MHVRRAGLLLLALVVAASCGSTRAISRAPTPTPSGIVTEPAPAIFLHSPAVLARHKARWRSGQRSPAIERLLDDATRALAVEPFSVTEKRELPPSGDKHDYLSLAPYAWPDPRRPDGLPYIIRDGRTNRERDDISDHKQLARIIELGETLALAYFFTGNDAYVAQLARLLRVFFIDAQTRMSPHLAYAQLVRGKSDGRAAGIIDAAELPRLIDALGLVSASGAYGASERAGMTAWFGDYLAWLRESELGRREGQAKNNHGTWYDVQVVSLALATGQPELAREALAFARKRRVGRAVEPDGSLPDELVRTRSWHYAVYHTRALTLLANLGANAGVELWHYQTPDGRSIRKTIDWLVPFALGEKSWTTPEIGGFAPRELAPILAEAAMGLSDPRLASAARRIGGDAAARWQLFVE